MSSNIPYISIKSILYDISLTVEEQYWNESKMLEWANKGLRKINTNARFESAVCVVAIEEHTANMPSDMKYLTQIAYKKHLDAIDIEYFQEIMNLKDLPWNAALQHMHYPLGLPAKAAEVFTHSHRKWVPMRKSNNTFALSVLCANKIPECPNCEFEYNITPSGNLISDLKNGLIMVSYLRNPVNEDGDALIPNDEDLKDALFHYCMYRYWMVKRTMKEEGSRQERDYHLQRYEILKAKAAGKLNSPSIDELENIKDMTNKLYSRGYRYDSFFGNLNNRESEQFNSNTQARNGYGYGRHY